MERATETDVTDQTVTNAAEREVRHYELFIGGRWTPPAAEQYFTSICPGDGQPVARVARGSEADVDRAVAAAREAFDSTDWGHPRSGPARAELLRAVAAGIRDRKEELALLEALDSGKPILETTMVDVPLAADTFEFFADQVASLPAGEIVPVPAEVLDFTLREPIGVCGAIVPWNFPLMFVAWKTAPALAAGNTVVFKPAELTSVTAMEVARILDEAGAPPGVFNLVSGSGAVVGSHMVRHPGVDKISFTGSTGVGREIQQLAAGTIKRLTLELGGKSPNVVFEDADLDQAVRGTMNGIFLNQGEMCTAGSRLLVHESIHEEFVARLVERAQQIKPGHPTDWDARIGALITPQHRARVLEYVRQGVAAGAVLRCGGKPPDDPALAAGNYLLPTILDQVRPDAVVFREEIFGPVLVVTPFADDEEAVRLANDTCYGLGSGLWTRNLQRALKLVRRLRAGTVWVNNYAVVGPHTPFGGFRQSGFGKDLGRAVLDDYTQLKNVYIELGDEVLTLYDA